MEMFCGMPLECAFEKCRKPFRPQHENHRCCSLSCSRKLRYWSKPELFRKAQLVANNKFRRIRQQQRPWLKLLDAAKTRAAVLKINCDLDAEWCKAQYTGSCALTKIPFSYEGVKKGPKMYAPSVDRKDSTKGYTKDNCRIILLAVNAMKHTGTDEDVYKIAEALINHKPPP